MEGSCKHGNESSGSKKHGDDFDYLRSSLLLKDILHRLIS